MQKSKLLIAVLGALVAVPAMADTSPFSGNVALTTNYLYRGISQSGNNPAIQGGFDYKNPNGFYVGTWGSSISWLSDTGTTGGTVGHGGLELDTYLGYGGSFADDFSYDVGYLRYNYPGKYNGATSANTDEFHGLIGYKWVSFKYSYSTSNLFGVADSKGSTYAELNASYGIDAAGITVGAHYGDQKVKHCSACSYKDYNISASKDLGGYAVTLLYSNTDLPSTYVDGYGSKVADGKVVLSLSHSM